mmetsp:Transcript_59158/g.175752  ORF Transcript_59158/g.175752 Transcript_59158/m.175752 type:complete len:149 (+) Transcript_59158:3-449(+)
MSMSPSTWARCFARKMRLRISFALQALWACSAALELHLTASHVLQDELPADAHAAGLTCPMNKVGCPLCYEIIDHWNSQGKVPERTDTYCTAIATKWQAMYETLTGKPQVETRERTRCVAVAAGLQEVVRQGCALPNCSPAAACATFC